MPPNTNTYPTPPAPGNQPAPVGPQQYGMQMPVAPAQPASKKILLIVTGVAAAVLIAAAGIWLWSRSAASQFVSAVPGYESRSKEAYDYFLGLSDRLSHGKEIGDKFGQTIASAPQEPKLLGMSPAPADKVKRVSDLTAAMEKFKTTYVAAADVSAYSEQTLKAMSAVTGTVNSPDAMMAVLPKLAQVKTTISAVKQPDAVKTFHASLIAKYDTAIKDLNDALSAYDSGKTAEYTNSVEKLPADFQALSPNGARDELEAIFNSTYGEADKAFGDLQKLLGINN